MAQQLPSTWNNQQNVQKYFCFKKHPCNSILRSPFILPALFSFHWWFFRNTIKPRWTCLGFTIYCNVAVLKTTMISWHEYDLTVVRSRDFGWKIATVLMASIVMFTHHKYMISNLFYKTRYFSNSLKILLNVIVSLIKWFKSKGTPTISSCAFLLWNSSRLFCTRRIEEQIHQFCNCHDSKTSTRFLDSTHCEEPRLCVRTQKNGDRVLSIVFVTERCL